MNCSIKIYRNNVTVYYKKNNSVCRYNIGLKIKPILRNKKFVDWNYQKERFLSHVPNAEQNNKTISSWETRANEIISNLIAEGISPTGNLVQEKLQKTKNDIEKKALKTFMDFYKEFLKNKKEYILNNVDKSDASIKDYITLENTMIDFINEHGELYLDDLDEKWFYKFKAWLQVKRPEGSKTKGLLNSKTIKKRLDVMKTFFIWLETMKYHNEVALIKDVCKKHKTQKTIFDTISIEEVKAFYAMNLEFEKLNNLKDIFVFSCLTSLRYFDLMSLEPKHFVDGKLRKIANKTRNTSGAEHIVPLNEISKEIAERHNYSLPKYSNVKANEYLKEALNHSKLFTRKGARKDENGIPLAIKDSLVMHDGRRTFISNMVNNSPLSWNKIMQMSAHTKTQSLFEYIDKSRELEIGATDILC